MKTKCTLTSNILNEKQWQQPQFQLYLVPSAAADLPIIIWCTVHLWNMMLCNCIILFLSVQTFDNAKFTERFLLLSITAWQHFPLCLTRVQHILLFNCDTTKVAPCILELLICGFLILNQIFGGAAYQEVFCSTEITILGFQLVKIGGWGNASVKLMYHQYNLHVSLVFAFFPKSPPTERANYIIFYSFHYLLASACHFKKLWKVCVHFMLYNCFFWPFECFDLVSCVFYDSDQTEEKKMWRVGGAVYNG